MKDIILYHGSRGGIEGPIQPKSRERCDFGCGFYMGTSAEQAKALVVNDDLPTFYKLRLRLSEIPEEKVYIPSNEDWLKLVLAFRKQVKEFSLLPEAEIIREKLKQYDVVIGPISDDRMRIAMLHFADGSLTDKGLISCLQEVNYGTQYVALTPFACEKIDILSEYVLSESEIQEVKKYSDVKRKEGDRIVSRAIRQFRNDGLYLDEFLEHIIEKEVAFRGV